MAKIQDKLDEEIERRRAKARLINNSPERKEYMRRWMAANKEKRKTYMRSYLEKNRERHNERGRVWKELNYEKDRLARRARYKNYKEKKCAQAREVYHRDRLTPKSIAKELYGGALQRSKKRRLEFGLTREWVIERLGRGVCEVSGLPFDRGAGMHNPMSASIDRIDITKGYTPDNCRVVIWAVNNLKGVGTDETMWRVVDAMVANRERRRKGMN